MLVRPAAPADFPAIHAIYAHHVLTGLASFEEAPPSQEELQRRYREITDGGLPYLTAELDGIVAGYGYCALYRTRSAYRHTLEDSVYVRQDMIGRGVGSALLGELIRRCEGLGYRQIIAVIGDSRECRVDRAAREPRLPARRHAALGGLQVRPLGRQRDDAAAPGPGRRRKA